ncbi:MAG TPA: PPC domain-containing protein [Thermoanaerobaculia bacterium]|jgi:hypothetical protein|nr:PPC domain-containing protein [Thermoanaerobaculia bacterium]
MPSRIARVSLLAGLGSLAAVLLNSAALVLTPIPESEPNDTPATATPVTLVGGCQTVSGSISPGGDLDYFSFTASPGSRVWAFVDTSASPTGQNDSLLRLFGPDGTTQLEQDDDDGTATNCGATLVNQLSSAIAGRTLTAGGTYFLRVEGVGAPVASYRLIVVVTSSAASEVEPNETPATANPIVASGALIGVRNGEITSTTDADVYSVVAPAGSTLFISADGDPERNGGVDLVVDLISSDGSTVLISVDSSDNVGFPAPPTETFCFNITTAGTYFVRVRGFQSQTKTSLGTYSLMVAACGVPATPTPTPTVTNTQVVGGPSATPTQTRTVTPTPTATATGGAPTATRTFTPIGGGPAPAEIPTLSFPMLTLMGLGLLGTAFLILRRL